LFYNYYNTRQSLVKQYFDKIYNWSIKKTNNKEDAEDLTNSVFLAIFEYFNKDIKVEKLENLIWKIAYNLWSTKAKNYIKEKNNTEFDEEYQSIDNTDMLDKVIYREIVNNLDNVGLTVNEKKAFELYYINDLSIKEISEKLDSSDTNIKYYLYSARKKIKERYYE
jgi:RNA polymerase sigma-70 factor (ECF subfamily)